MKGIVLFAALFGTSLVSSQRSYTLDSSVPVNNVFDGFVSYSIEFSSFPDFAGNNSHPNTFSDNLLENIRDIIGTKPYIRVGGNTQDHALYNASLPYALNGTIDPKRSPDYPTTVYIGPSYFESYNTWKDVKFTHGFNLGLGGNSSAGWQTLLDTVPLACAALEPDKVSWWEYGNEPDLYSTSSHGPVRPGSWSESVFVDQWLNGTRMIKSLLEEHCPDSASTYGFLGPSFGGLRNTLTELNTWAAGINRDGNIKLFSTHNYISGATSPGVTLQGTLMNHTNTKRSVDAHVTEYNKIKNIDANVPPLIFGETNSLYNQGKPGLSNSFGAALWGLDFNLYSASVGFKRVHMHMGTNYRYASWQPVPTNLTTLGTKPPYYGNIAVAAMLGNLTAPRGTTIVSVPLSSSSDHFEFESAYAAYTHNGTALARVMLINMHAYNTTLDGAGLVALPEGEVPARPSVEVSLSVGVGTSDSTGGGSRSRRRKVILHRLWANGSDAITGITWDGWSYNYELDGGRPVRLANGTTVVGETAEVSDDGVVVVSVPASSAVMVDFLGKGEEENDGDGEGDDVKGRGAPGDGVGEMQSFLRMPEER